MNIGLIDVDRGKRITLDEALSKASPVLRRKMEHTRDVVLKALPLALKYDEKGFFVGFSGGKDSQALYHMMRLCDVPMRVYFSPTSVDPPEVIRFIRKYYPEVEFVKIHENIYDVFKQMRVLPTMKIRWCCAHFKERGGEGKVVCTGVRKAESVRRSKRNEIEVSGRKFSGHMDEFEDWQEKRIRRKMKNLNQDQFSDVKESEVRCINGKDKILLNPIIDWTEGDVWEFLNKVVEVPHCELYDRGWTRIGCICCPMASLKSTIRDEQRWPHVKEKWIRAIMDVRKESILANTPPNRVRHTSSTPSKNYTPPQECGVMNSIRNWNGSKDVGKISPPHTRREDEYSSIKKCQNPRAVSYPAPGNQSEPRRCSDCSTPQRTLDGKFLDSGNGDCSAVAAEYDEQKERMIAEAIYDWWRSKRPFKQWFAETYQQGTLDFGEDV